MIDDLTGTGNVHISRGNVKKINKMSQADALAEIKEKFEGNWKVDRSENFEDFLREVGTFILIAYIPQKHAYQGNWLFSFRVNRSY